MSYFKIIQALMDRHIAFHGFMPLLFSLLTWNLASKISVNIESTSDDKRI